MHRSGTSAFAGTAVRLGLAAPRTPFPTTPDNRAGFYESQPVVLANQDILLEAGCAWNISLTFEPDRLSRVPPQAARQSILNTLKKEFGDTASFVLKVPRHALGVLIVGRQPAEVVRSPAVCDRLPDADAAAHWLHHALEAERASRGLGPGVRVL